MYFLHSFLLSNRGHILEGFKDLALYSGIRVLFSG